MPVLGMKGEPCHSLTLYSAETSKVRFGERNLCKRCAPFDSLMLARGGVINFEVLLKGEASFTFQTVFLHFSYFPFDSVMLAGGVINFEFLQGQGLRQG